MPRSYKGTKYKRCQNRVILVPNVLLLNNLRASNHKILLDKIFKFFFQNFSHKHIFLVLEYQNDPILGRR